MSNIEDTFLITGATGFLGSNILRKMFSSGNRLVVLKRSTSNLGRIKEFSEKLKLYDSDKINLEEIFQENKITKIIHCATNYGRFFSTPLEVIEANLILPLRLLELGEKYNINCFINTDTILDKRMNYYSLSKSQFKQWLEVYSTKKICINIELEHFFGPYDDESKFVTFIVHNLLNEVDKIDLTKGEQKRSFIYIDDVVAAFEKIIEYSGCLKNGFYNFAVGSKEILSIKEFVELTKVLTGNKKTILNFGALPYRKNEIMDVEIDISPLESLGWQPEIPLKKGLSMTIETERIILIK